MTIPHSNITHLSGKYSDQGIVTCNHGYHTGDGGVTYNISCGVKEPSATLGLPGGTGTGSGTGSGSGTDNPEITDGGGEWFGIKECSRK